MRRSRPAILLALFLLLGLAPVAPFAARPAAAAPTCFPQNTRCMEGAFRDYWRSHGGLEILGLPVSQPFVDSRGLIVQYYERAIFEWHPENAPEYQVLLTRLGDTALGKRAERNAPAQPCLPPACATLAETGHTLRGAFLQYWQANGGLAVFGLPLTEEFVEINPSDKQPYTVQYFERNRFEQHPEARDPRYRVLLGLLGGEALKAQPTLAARPAVAVPEFTRVVGLPKRLTIPSLKVDATVESVGVDATNTMETPSAPMDVAWYRHGARPGQLGNAVLAGHVDFANFGPAVFWEVRLLQPGAEIFVTDDAGLRWRFIVRAVERYPVSQFPGQQVFGATESTMLNLISCIGDFDPTNLSYNQRVVIFSEWDGLFPKGAR